MNHILPVVLCGGETWSLNFEKNKKEGEIKRENKSI
jgi:hypothetical protein